LRIAILTTETLHHAFFVREVCRHWNVAGVVEETGGVQPPFDTHHPFEDDRDAYERDLWFDGRTVPLSDFAPVSRHENINSPDAVDAVAKLAPDIAVVFGTRRLRPPVIGIAHGATINLHGGHPERYRGLDSHLWAIYHRDFDGLSTTLHFVNEELDDGDIVDNRPIELTRGMELPALRAANTGVCIRLVVDALDAFDKNGNLPRTPQSKVGRYYSFMPAVLKDGCLNKFGKHTASL